MSRFERSRFGHCSWLKKMSTTIPLLPQRLIIGGVYVCSPKPSRYYTSLPFYIIFSCAHFFVLLHKEFATKVKSPRDVRLEKLAAKEAKEAKEVKRLRQAKNCMS